MRETEQYFSPTIEVNGSQNSLITNFLQNIFLCVQNKHIHTGLDLLEDDFCVYCPFNLPEALQGCSLFSITNTETRKTNESDKLTSIIHTTVTTLNNRSLT